MAGTSRLVKLLYKSLLKSYTTYESYFDADPPRRLMTQLQTSLSGGRPGLASDRLPGNVERLPISSIDIVRLSFRANMDKTDPVEIQKCISTALSNLRKLNSKSEVLGAWDEVLKAVAVNPNEAERGAILIARHGSKSKVDEDKIHRGIDDVVAIVQQRLTEKEEELKQHAAAASQSSSASVGGSSVETSPERTTPEDDEELDPDDEELIKLAEQASVFIADEKESERRRKFMQSIMKKVRKLRREMEQQQLPTTDAEWTKWRASQVANIFFSELNFSTPVPISDIKHHFLDYTLEKKRGLPIVVSLIFMVVCRRLGLPVALIPFPRKVYSTLLLDDADSEGIYFDPNLGVRKTRKQLQEQLLLEGFKESDFPGFLRPMSLPQIYERMIKNLLFSSKDDPDESAKWQAHFMALRQAARRYFPQPPGSE